MTHLVTESVLAQRAYLLGQLIRRDVLLKYRGSYLGLSWSFFHPLLLLAAFTIVFSHILGSRWTAPGQPGIPQALLIYCGLVVFSPYSEVLATASRLLLSYQNYVKKIVFPTEILPLALVGTATLHAGANLLVLTAVAALAVGPHWTMLLAPVVLLPAWLFLLGVAWMLAALGAFVRDLVHVMPVFAQMLMFLSPIFYPAQLVPKPLASFYALNPLAQPIEDLRRVLLMGTEPHWAQWVVMLLIGGTVAILGYFFFTRSKEEFADVL
jgi:lipopolysaccharide transport system permease protein